MGILDEVRLMERLPKYDEEEDYDFPNWRLVLGVIAFGVFLAGVILAANDFEVGIVKWVAAISMVIGVFSLSGLGRPNDG